MSENPPDKRRRAPSKPPVEPATAAARRGGPPLVMCPHCESQVPAGEFCGPCGAHLGTAATDRRHAFAAMPNEPVIHFNVISTLFPHLSHRHGGPFRWALIAAVVFVVLLAALHLFAPATAAAAFLLPALYLLYLYEVEVYEEEPWLLIGATMVAGAVLGYAFVELAERAATVSTLAGDTSSSFALRGVAIHIVAQPLMLAGPLFLYLARSRYREPLDGLTFGAASALGFSLAAELVSLWPLLGGPLIASGNPVDWALRLLRLGVLVSLVNASTTGMIAASLWLHRYDARRAKRSWEVSLLATLIVGFGVQVVLGALTYTIRDLIVQVLVWAVATVALMLYVRQVIHQSLLSEGVEHEIRPDSQCPECHHIVPTMLFCPNCGASRLAAARSSRGGRVA